MSRKARELELTYFMGSLMEIRERVRKIKKYENRTDSEIRALEHVVSALEKEHRRLENILRREKIRK